MPYLIAGFLVLWLALFVLRSFARLSPAAAALAVRRGGGIVVLAAAVLLLLRERLEVAIPLGMFGFWLLGWRPGAFFGTRAKPSRGATSRVRSAMIEMELDHDSGAMHGSVLAGTFQERALDSLRRQDCLALYEECRRDDPEGARLLEVYLDRRFPGWRPAGEADQNARAGEGDVGATVGPMTENEAYEVLGLRKGASRDEIARAHRALMKKLHPDRGGSTHLAARANQAKDVLMRRHT